MQSKSITTFSLYISNYYSLFCTKYILATCSYMERVQIFKFMFVAYFLVISSNISCVLGFNVHSIFIFGDSIIDAGNNQFKNNCSVQANFTPYGSNFFHHPTGRFTNGRTVTDFICEFIGIPMQKPVLELVNENWKYYPSNGINFASGGSGVLQTTNQDLGVTPIQEQLQQFKTLVQQNKIKKKQIQESLFIFTSGSNDIFTYFNPFNVPKLTLNAYVQAMLTQMTKFVDQIYKLGARRITLISLGPVGCIPARALLPGAPIDKCYGKMNKMVKNYNVGLENLVKRIPIKYPSSFAVYGDVYKTVQNFRANPKRYGFSDVTNACCGDGTLGGALQCGKEGYKLCAKPNEYLFWDYFHPSEHTYNLISKTLWNGTYSQIRPVNLKTLANMTLI